MKNISTRRKTRTTILRYAIVGCLLLLMGLLVITGAKTFISHYADGRLYSDIHTIPHNRVGVVLGCAKYLADGRRNLFFMRRIEAAVRLFKAGKIDYILVTGDNHKQSYDEASDMKDSLVKEGVPAEKIYCDYAGFSTFDSMIRANRVFGLKKFTIISQEFHNKRAIFIARNLGLDTIGFNAPAVDPVNSFKTKLREQFAVVKTVLDLYILGREPKFLGKPVKIE